MTLEELIHSRRDEIVALAASRGAHQIRLFGSTARGESGPDSDVDFLVDLDEGRSLIDLGGLQIDLQETLGCPVQVTTAEGLHWYIRDRVLAEAVPL